MVGPDPTLRGGDAGAGHRRSPARVQTTMQWFIDNRPELADNIADMEETAMVTRACCSIVTVDSFHAYCATCWTKTSFCHPLASGRCRRSHRDHPYMLLSWRRNIGCDYEPAESTHRPVRRQLQLARSGLVSGNYLIIESLQKFHHYLRRRLQGRMPHRVGQMMTLWDVAAELSRRLTRIFLRDDDGRRPVYGGSDKFQHDPHWRDFVLFYEYFHGDNGAASAPAIRPAGPALSPSSCSRVVNKGRC